MTARRQARAGREVPTIAGTPVPADLLSSSAAPWADNDAWHQWLLEHEIDHVPSAIRFDRPQSRGNRRSRSAALWAERHGVLTNGHTADWHRLAAAGLTDPH